MIVGDLLLAMNKDPYYGPPMARSTCHALFAVVVSNRTGVSALTISVEHRNRDDTAWSTAGSFTSITANGTYTLELTGLKELVRYQYDFTVGGASDGMYVFAANPQWLQD